MILTGIQPILTRDPVMPENATTLGRLEEVVSTPEEFDRVVSPGPTDSSRLCHRLRETISARNRPMERRYRT